MFVSRPPNRTTLNLPFIKRLSFQICSWSAGPVPWPQQGPWLERCFPLISVAWFMGTQHWCMWKPQLAAFTVTVSFLFPLCSTLSYFLELNLWASTLQNAPWPWWSLPVVCLGVVGPNQGLPGYSKCCVLEKSEFWAICNSPWVNLRVEAGTEEKILPIILTVKGLSVQIKVQI